MTNHTAKAKVKARGRGRARARGEAARRLVKSHMEKGGWRKRPRTHDHKEKDRQRMVLQLAIRSKGHVTPSRRLRLLFRESGQTTLSYRSIYKIRYLLAVILIEILDKKGIGLHSRIMFNTIYRERIYPRQYVS
jgi:hypothetical protein